MLNMIRAAHMFNHNYCKSNLNLCRTIGIILKMLHDQVLVMLLHTIVNAEDTRKNSEST